VGQGCQGNRNEGGLRLLCAGAAQSLATALASRHGIPLQAEFGAVGAIRQRFLDGAPCDVIILTRAMIKELPVKASADLGSVPTCLAVRASDPTPDVANLKAALQGKDLYFPDPQKSTAGAQFMKALTKLGVSGPFRTYPNGTTAMHEMAKATGSVIGCTQATEILATPGLRLVAPLPGEFALETTYSAGLLESSGEAKRYFELLTGQESLALRTEKGFNA
jgi:molybdate transport system substrate-binding protein